MRKKLGEEHGEKIDWSNPRLLCIAGDFTKYDIHAVQQINRNIELIRYRQFEDNLLLLDLVNASAAQNPPSANDPKPSHSRTFTDDLERADVILKDRYELLKAFIEALGDDVQIKVLKYYVAFKRIKNFACVGIGIQKKELIIWIKTDPESIRIEQGFTRDVRSIGHYGTGDLEILIKSDADLEKAKPLILQSYDSN